MLAGALVLAVGVLVSQTRRLYFFGDEWSFLLKRDLSWPGVMEPHNEHWSTLPLIAYRTMFHVLGIDHHLLYALMPIALHVACCVLSYLLMRKHDIAAWPAVVAVIALAFLAGDLGENPLWSFQIGFLGSAALGLSALLVTGPGRRRLVLTWALTVLSLMCSGMALPLMIWLGAYLLVSRGLGRALLATVPPGVVYLIWFAAYGRDATAQAPRADAVTIVEFAWTGVAHVWQTVLVIPSTGGVVLLGLLGVALLAVLPDLTRALALSGMLTLITTYLFLGLSRAGLGVEASTASRYAYFGVLFSLPAFATALSLLAERLRGRTWELRLAGAVLAVILAATGVAQTVAFTDARLPLTAGLEQRILATEVLIGHDERFLSQGVSVPYNPDVSITALSEPEIRDSLPDAPVSSLDLMNASVVLQVAGAPSDLDLPAASDLGTHGLDEEPAPQGCSSLKAGVGSFLDLPPEADGSQVVVTSHATTYPVQLVSGDRVSDPAILPSTPDGPTWIGSTATDGTLRVNLPAGAVEICIGSAT